MEKRKRDRKRRHTGRRRSEPEEGKRAAKKARQWPQIVITRGLGVATKDGMRARKSRHLQRSPHGSHSQTRGRRLPLLLLQHQLAETRQSKAVRLTVVQNVQLSLGA